MARRRPSQRPQRAAPRSDTTGQAGAASRARGWLLAVLTALFVARPLSPTEGAAAHGDGIPMVMLILLLLTGWLLWGVLQGRLAMRLAWVDAAWAALLFWHSLSALRATGINAPRPALNMLWEWLALGLGFFLVRQLLESRREQRALAAVMVALSVALAAFGLHQYLYSLPATRAEYQKNPERALAQAGIAADDQAGVERFEQRLASTEPMATFALANSLAGVLAAWLVVAAGIGCTTRLNGLNRHDDSRAQPAAGALNRWTWLAAGLTAAPIAAGLLLTKSRSGYLAAAVGAVLVALCVRSGRQRIGWRGALVAAAAAPCLLAAGFALGALDLQVLSEAAKSLGYRLQYWKASMAMISEQPLFGCGPGSFQDFYARYKLPGASEVVAEPHNMFVEVWATAGTPALVALVGVLAAAGWHLIARRRSAAPAPAEPSSEQQSAAAFVIAGGAAGFLLAFLAGHTIGIGLSAEALAWGLIVAGGAVCLLMPWVLRGRMPAAVPLAGAIAMGVNLLAAGGIGFAGVAGSLWLLVGLALAVGDTGQPRYHAPRRVAAVGAVAGLGLVVACFSTAYLPVIECRVALLKAEAEMKSGGPLSSSLEAERRATRTAEHLQAAARADRWADEPWKQLATLEFSRWRFNRDPAAFVRFEHANLGVLRLRPESNVAWRQAGQWYLEAHRLRGREVDLGKAVASFQRAVELYPNQATLRALLAEALQRSGELAGARPEAAEALRLDRLTPHVDQKLQEEEVRRMIQLSRPDAP
ncbi:MAG: O-antigen ligase family protein [Pirellulales bacterium]